MHCLGVQISTNDLWFFYFVNQLKCPLKDEKYVWILKVILSPDGFVKEKPRTSAAYIQMQPKCNPNSSIINAVDNSTQYLNSTLARYYFIWFMKMQPAPMSGFFLEISAGLRLFILAGNIHLEVSCMKKWKISDLTILLRISLLKSQKISSQ